jgi:predicted ester cyclase
VLALEKRYKEMYRAMADWKAEFSSIIFSGDTIVFEGVSHGTFTGPMTTPEGEVAPTGKSVNIRVAFFAKISTDGLIAEERIYFDNLNFMKQLGLMK